MQNAVLIPVCSLVGSPAFPGWGPLIPRVLCHSGQEWSSPVPHHHRLSIWLTFLLSGGATGSQHGASP